MRTTVLSLFSALSLVACGAMNPAEEQVGDSQQSLQSPDVRPTGLHETRQASGPSDNGTHKSSGNGISYHSGPLMLGSQTINVIWYGGWSGNTATTILPGFITALGGSGSSTPTPYEHINTTYYDGSGTHVSGVFSVGTQVSDNYSRGNALADSDIQAIVEAHIANNDFAENTNAIYFVLTSSDVNETSGFCSKYCGWHTNYNRADGANIKYSFVGNPDRCPSACEAQTTSPNNNAGADGMASIIAHESEEAISDPDGSAWYDNRGYENADKCAWTFGTESTASNGSKYNIVLAGVEYLIQRNWVNASGGYCAMSY